MYTFLTPEKRLVFCIFSFLNIFNGFYPKTHNYFDSTYGCDEFLRIIDFMPYIVKLTFEDMEYISCEEILIVKKEYKGAKHADTNNLFNKISIRAKRTD